MQHRRVYGWVSPVMTVVLASVAWAGEADKKGGEHEHATRAEIGEPAPDFALKDLDGKEHRLSDFKGKLVVLEWTNRKCPYVQFHQGKARTMQKTAAEFKDKDVVWLAIDSSHFSGKEKDQIRKFAEEHEYDFPILLDPDGDVGRTYQAKTTPHMFVIDREGILVYHGAIDSDPNVRAAGRDPDKVKNYVAEALSALTEGKEVERAETRPYGCSVKYVKGGKKKAKQGRDKDQGATNQPS